MKAMEMGMNSKSSKGSELECEELCDVVRTNPLPISMVSKRLHEKRALQ
jgi:hypothetical protein